VTTRTVASARCVVTGGLGFIGSNLVHALCNRGACVSVIDALVPGHGGDRQNVAGLDVELVHAEIGTPRCAEVIRDADIVFNLAGQVSHIASMLDPQRDLHLNLTTHALFLEQLRLVNPKARIVHASTRQVYGRSLRTPVDEDHPTNPVDVNGVAKLAGEQLHMVYARAYGMAITSLRLTNVYGPRQRLCGDDLGFLPVFIRHALRGERIELFGDGSQRRDCLHVADVVSALLAATEPTTVGGVYNLGHPDDHTLAEIAEVITDLAGSDGGVVTTAWPDDRQRIDIGSFHTDGERFHRAAGWAPAFSLDDGIADTLAFYREHPWYLS
jgi:UDP-glucose 4-epimerase